jgi:prephenate dehydrogenase
MKGVKKIAIVGVGLMGGSLSLALRKKFPKISVWGYARSQKSYRKLKRLRILDRVERDLKKVVEDADLVVLALPVEAIITHFEKIAPCLKQGAVVFDLGSSKKMIESSITRQLPRGVKFVGCHPLCGSEKGGAEFSTENLYRKALCLITSSPQSNATRRIKKIWEKLGAKVIFVTPRRHDEFLSYLSHLPHLIAFSLTRAFPAKHSPFCLKSFKDLTRISISPAAVWTDILLSNKKNILKDLNRFMEALKEFEHLIKKEDKGKIIELISKVNIKQRHLV